MNTYPTHLGTTMRDPMAPPTAGAASPSQPAPTAAPASNAAAIATLDEWIKQAEHRSDNHRRFAERVDQVREMVRSCGAKLPSGWEANFNVARQAFSDNVVSTNALLSKQRAERARLAAGGAPADIAHLRTPVGENGPVVNGTTLAVFGPASQIPTSSNLDIVRTRIVSQCNDLPGPAPAAAPPPPPPPPPPPAAAPPPAAPIILPSAPSSAGPSSVNVTVSAPQASAAPAAATPPPSPGVFDRIKTLVSEKPWLLLVAGGGALWAMNRGGSKRR